MKADAQIVAIIGSATWQVDLAAALYRGAGFRIVHLPEVPDSWALRPRSQAGDDIWPLAGGLAAHLVVDASGTRRLVAQSLARQGRGIFVENRIGGASQGQPVSRLITRVGPGPRRWHAFGTALISYDDPQRDACQIVDGQAGCLEGALRTAGSAAAALNVYAERMWRGQMASASW